jgi:hypothetical protein
MIKEYRDITGIGLGETIDSVIKKMKSARGLVSVEFNGVMLYSDIDDVDSAYKKVTGMTKAEFDAEIQREREQYLEEEKRHKDSIPRLTKEWVEKGCSILDAKYHDSWRKCVPIRLSDLYRGMELECCLDIVKELNNGCTLESAKKIIEGQGHSGMSFSLVCLMVSHYCDRGVEFMGYVRK